MEGVSGELGPTVDELVEIARAAGEKNAGRRTIHHWVSKRNVARPGRVGREWRYPSVAIGQVETVARLRQRGIDPALIRFALFIETATVPPAEALALCHDFLVAWDEVLEREGRRLRHDANALQDEAATAARMRARSPLPHRVRGVSFDARTLAMTLAMARLFDVPLGSEQADEGLHHLERILGLRGGRGGADRDLAEVTLKPADWPGDAGSLHAALESATPQRIEFARRGVEFAVVWLPAMSATLAAWFEPSATPLVDIFEEWAEKLTPDVHVLMFALFLRNGAERASDQEIRDALRVFTPALAAAEILRERPLHERNAVLRRLRCYQQLQLGLVNASSSVAR